MAELAKITLVNVASKNDVTFFMVFSLFEQCQIWSSSDIHNNVKFVWKHHEAYATKYSAIAKNDWVMVRVW